jgi:hypothetical protein
MAKVITDLSREFNPAPKLTKKQAKQQRGSKTAKQRGAITPDVYGIAAVRSGGRCERCGWRDGQYDSLRWGLEAAHYMRRHNFGQEGVQPWDILMLCGPSGNTGTCHHWIDSTRAGMEWAKAKREELYARQRQATDAIGRR